MALCCPQPSEMSSLRSWMPSLLRSRCTEEEARSSPQPGEWCTLLSSWWDHPSPIPLPMPLALTASPFIPFMPTFYNVPLRWLRLGILLTCGLFNCSAITFLFHSFGFYPCLLWLSLCLCHKSSAIHETAMDLFLLPLTCALSCVPGHTKADGAVLLRGGSGSGRLCVCCVHCAGS